MGARKASLEKGIEDAEPASPQHRAFNHGGRDLPILAMGRWWPRGDAFEKGRVGNQRGEEGGLGWVKQRVSPIDERRVEW